MRGSKAKALRRAVDFLASDKPKVAYTYRKVRKIFRTMTVNGLTDIAVEINVATLGDCKRKLYQTIKKDYKRGLLNGY